MSGAGQIGSGMGPRGDEAPPLRIHRVALKLASVKSSGTSLLTTTVSAVVMNPSRRLSCGFSVAFEPSSAQAVSSYGASSWTVTALRENPVTKRIGELHALETAQALPRMYELDSAIRRFRIACTLAIPTTAAAATIPGDWYLVVEWEPNQMICDDDVRPLLHLTDVRQEFAAEATLAP